MNIRVYRKKPPKMPRLNMKKPKFDGPTEKWCRPKLIYGLDGKSILTTSKWFKNPYTAIFDWLQRGFLCIEEKDGGGFEWRDFPVINFKETIAKYEEKFKNASETD